MAIGSGPLAAALLACLAMVWAAACESESPGAPVCVAGASRLCSGELRCSGIQTCLADGRGYSDCDCDAPPPDPPSNQFPDEPVPRVRGLGGVCSADAGCSAGLRCFTPQANEFLGAGAPNGYCSASCSSESDCTALDPASDCFGEEATGTGVCVLTCQSKDPGMYELKCQARSDLVCRSEASLGLAEPSMLRQRGWCLPQCGSDDDCGARRCDVSSGSCVDGPLAGAAVGEFCQEDSECASGECFHTAGGGASCAGNCSFGARSGCGFGETAASKEAGCVFPRITGPEREGIGDLGICFELCDVDSDCAQRPAGDWFCLRNNLVQIRYGREGACTHLTSGSTADAGATP